MHFKPEQLIRYGGKNWKIDGNHLGIVKQCDMVELTNATESNGRAHGDEVATMFIPSDLLEAAIAGGAELYERIS